MILIFAPKLKQVQWSDVNVLSAAYMNKHLVKSRQLSNDM